MQCKSYGYDKREHDIGAKIENYRLVSVLTVLSKIFEKIVNKRLVAFLKSNKLIHNNQYGFRKNTGTQAAVTDMINRINVSSKKRSLPYL